MILFSFSCTIKYQELLVYPIYKIHRRIVPGWFKSVNLFVFRKGQKINNPLIKQAGEMNLNYYPPQ